MNFFLVAILVFISPTLSEIREDLFLPFPKLRSIFSKLNKRQGDGGYLEQCGIVDFGERKLGTVNVLAFFDATWQYSHRQAAMLKELKGRFERSGMVDINFFVIISTPSTIIEQGEIEIEEDTWKAIAPIEAEGFPPIETSLESLNKTLGPEFYFIEDNSQLQIWKKLHVSRNQILVVDGCGKLTYQVIVPWSILHFPYVKAAILSTYKDEACGPCTKFSEDIIKEVEPKEVKKEEITTEELEISEGETTLLEIETPSTEGKTTNGITIVLESKEERTEDIKTPVSTATIQLENLDGTTEQIETYETELVLYEIEETTKEQIKTDATMPSDVQEEITENIERANGTTARIKNQEMTIEQAQRDVTIIMSAEETTTEPIKTDTGTIPLEIEDKTIEEIKRANHETTTLLENQTILTEQTQNYGTMTIPSKIEETTTEELKIDAVNTIPPIIEEETTEEMKRADDATTTQLENQEITTEETRRDGTMNTPSKIEETTTEDLKRESITLIPSNIEEEITEEMNRADVATTIRLENQAIPTEQTQRDDTMTIPSTIEEITTEAVTTIPSIIEEDTTEEMKKADDATTTQLTNQEITTEQTRIDGTINTPSEIEGTTTEDLKREAITLIPSNIEEETTEEMKRADVATTIRLENQAIPTEQTQRDDTMTIPSTIEEITTEAVTAIPSIIEEDTTEEMKRADDTTTILLENQAITTEQTDKSRTMTVPSKIEEATTEELKTEAVTAIPPIIKEMKRADDATTTQLEYQEITTQKTKKVETTIFSSEIEEKTTEEIKTEIPENYDLNYLGNDENSEQTRHVTENLKPNLDLKNSSEDLEHLLSKFPNVRSISTEIDKNKINLDQKFENGSNESAENPKDVPIRIILRAPHLDIYENSLIKHDYLILRTGDPDLHDHIDQGIRIESMDKNVDFEEGSADFENSDIWKIENRDFLNQKEVDVKIKNESKNKNGWYGFYVERDNYNDNNNDNKNTRKIKKRIFGKDESPGLYGEVADYWRNDGIEIFYDEAFVNEEDDKFYDMEKDQNDDAEISDVFKIENSFNGTEQQNVLEDQKDKNVANSIKNVLEEEARSKLIAHYSKLLPWIYYVLN